jgi:Flp pilus assembly secretin CpaC
MKITPVICGIKEIWRKLMYNGMKKIINRFVKSTVSSNSRVSQICIGNGNIQCRGNITRGKVIIDGKQINLDDESWIEDELATGNIKIEITGDVHKIDIPIGGVTVKGNVTGNIEISQGDIEIGGNVDGDVTTSMGDIIIKGNHSHGNVETSMGNVSIRCGE